MSARAEDQRGTEPLPPLKKRAVRRHHRQRMIQHARRVFAHMDLEDWAVKRHDHLKNCSCWMCGHRRKWDGLTIQEQRSLLRLRDEE